MTEDIIRKKLRENVEEHFDKMHDFEKDTKDSLESSGSYLKDNKSFNCEKCGNLIPVRENFKFSCGMCGANYDEKGNVKK